MNKTASNNTIKKVGWGFGLCNQNCVHCYNASSMGQDVPRYNLAQLKKVADKICPHISDINFGTGELLVNPNVRGLLDYIKRKYPRVKMSVTSNGYTIVMMTDAEIKKYFHDVDISIDFPSAEKHNNFRRHPMAWQWATTSLAKLQKIGVERSITTCITSKTTNQDIDGLLKLSNKYGAYLRFNWFRNVGRGSKSLRISPKRAWEIVKFLSKRAEFYSLDSIFAGPLGIKMLTCPAGSLSMRVHQDMLATPYPFLRGKKWSAGNLLDGRTTMNTIYNSKVFTGIRQRRVPYCRNCPYLALCRSGCITRAILHNGSMVKPDDFCPIQARIPKKLLNSIKLRVNNKTDLVHAGYLCTTIVKSL